MAKPNQKSELETEKCDIQYSNHFRRQTLLFSWILQLKYSSSSYQNPMSWKYHYLFSFKHLTDTVRDLFLYFSGPPLVAIWCVIISQILCLLSSRYVCIISFDSSPHSLWQYVYLAVFYLDLLLSSFLGYQHTLMTMSEFFILTMCLSVWIRNYRHTYMAKPPCPCHGTSYRNMLKRLHWLSLYPKWIGFQ